MTDATEQHHIVSSFDRDLEKIQSRIMKLGGLVEVSITDAVRALIDRDQELALQVRQNDKVIDALDEQIGEDTAQMIALRSPNAVDLRVILTVMRISGNLERIADYAKNVAKRSVVLTDAPEVGDSYNALRRMARDVELMLKDALDAYIQRDSELAMDVINRDHGVDQMYNALFRDLLAFMMQDPRNITPSMHLHFIAKNCERMGDHVTAIAENVVYLVTGTRPDNDRPKADNTSEMRIED
jgi:phosphate transport system protein